MINKEKNIRNSVTATDNSLNSITEQEEKKIINNFNQTQKEYDTDKKIHQLLEEMASCSPKEAALKSGDSSLTYCELNEQANQLANALIEQGVKQEQIIGVMVDRSFECIVAIYGILKAGCAYLPIDEKYPVERINYILKDSKASILLTNKELDYIEFSGKSIHIKSELMKPYDKENITRKISSDSLAYVIYTSGTTGNPKGIMITHRAVHNFIVGVCDRIPFQKGKNFVSVTTIAFDMFVVEGLVALSCGMQVIMASEEEQKSSDAFRQLVKKENITYISTTPSRIMLYLSDSSAETIFEGFEYVLLGGEAMPQKLIDKLTKVTKAEIYNLYGPTETTVYSTIQKVNKIADNNIGKPISNTRIYILDRDNKLQPIGVPGEICIAGDGVSKGYINKEALTCEKFIELPRFHENWVYRTGDIGKWLPNGTIELWGRIDNQVKIRGYRIELDEIDTCFMSYKAVTDCITIDRTDSGGNKYLCSYVVSEDKINRKELRSYISLKVPEYMVPSYIIQLDEIPMNINGKINRHALPEPLSFIEKHHQILEPQNDMEGKAVHIMSEVLGINNLSVTDDFFDLGGHSLKVAEFINRISDELHIELNFKDLYENVTPRQIAALCIRKATDHQNCGIPYMLFDKLGIKAVYRTKIYDGRTYNILYIEGTKNGQSEEAFHLIKTLVPRALPHYIFRVKDIEDEVELMSYQIDLEKGKEDAIQGKLEEIIHQLDLMDAEYGEAVKREGIKKNYDFSPLQCINLEIENQYSGTLIKLEEAIDIKLFTKAFLTLLSSQSTLRNAYNENGIIEYHAPAQINLPMLDLSEYSLYEQKIWKEHIFKHYIIKTYSHEAILHRVLLIKENLAGYSFIMPIHSIVFDGMSAGVLHKELLSNYRRLLDNKEVSKEINSLEFSEYILQIQKGPGNITKDDIINKYELKQYNDLASNIAFDNNSEEFFIELPMETIKKYSTFQNSWELTLFLVIQFYKKYFNLSQIPVALFVLGREFEDKTFFSSIGNYVTYIPAILEDKNKDIKGLSDKIRSQIEFAGKYNIHFPAIIMNEQIQEKYGEVLQLIFSNFESLLMLGHQDHVTEETIELNDLIGQWNTASIDTVGNRIIDVMCSKLIYRICFTGFKGYAERKSEIELFLIDKIKNLAL